MRTSTTTGAVPALIDASSPSGAMRDGVAAVAHAVIARASSAHAADIGRAERLISPRLRMGNVTVSMPHRDGIDGESEVKPSARRGAATGTALTGTAASGNQEGTAHG
ncbi:MAG TPA: hypothetical protein VEL05_08775 [Candidatus Acidoferrum sp.]|nr:hypothetical protein [Candidatus Acidoferrum sp.]